MGQAISPVLPFGVGVALSPLATIAVVLMFATPRGRANGAAFLAAWTLAIALLATVVLLVADLADADDDGGPAPWVTGLKLVLGLLLLLVAARQWRRRPRGGAAPELPGWMQSIASLTAPRAAGMAVLLAVVKPKNLLLTIGAGVEVAQTGAGPSEQAVALAVFVLLGALAPGIPVAIHVLLPAERAATALGAMRAWLVRENTTIIAVLCVLIAAKLIADAVGTLLG